MININYIENVGFIGEYNKDLSLELIKKLASSIYLLENNNIVLGYEPRLSSKKITSVIINSLRETNLNVYILGIVELPGLIYYSKINNAVGIMLTANNNLYSYNGIAIYNKGETITNDDIYIISRNMINPKNNNFKLGNVYYFNDYKYKYYSYLNNYLEKTNLKLLIDTQNGSISYYILDILHSLECEYNLINNKPNGTNINENYNKNYIISLSNDVINNYDLGVVFNGSGSEVNIILRNGNIIYSNEINKILDKYYKDINFYNNGLLQLFLIIKLLNKNISL